MMSDFNLFLGLTTLLILLGNLGSLLVAWTHPLIWQLTGVDTEDGKPRARREHKK
jgi:hypothetical protein